MPATAELLRKATVESQRVRVFPTEADWRPSADGRERVSTYRTGDSVFSIVQGYAANQPATVFQEGDRHFITGSSIRTIDVVGSRGSGITDGVDITVKRAEQVNVSNATVRIVEGGNIGGLLLAGDTRVSLPGVNQDPRRYIGGLEVAGDNNRYIGTGEPIRTGWKATS